MRRLIVAPFLLLICSFAAVASPLQPAQIEQWLAAAESLQALGQDIELNVDEQEQFDPSQFAQSIVSSINNSPYKDKILSTLGQHGFADLGSWAELTERIVMAFFALQVKGQEQMVEQAIQFLSMMQNNPDLPAEDREHLNVQIAQMQKMMDRVKGVPAGDVQAVEPFSDRFEQTFMDDEDSASDSVTQ